MREINISLVSDRQPSPIIRKRKKERWLNSRYRSLKMAQPKPPHVNNPAATARTGNTANGIAPLRDSDQPFVYDIRFSRRSFTLEFYDTASPNQHWTMLRPDVVVLTFDISNRETLAGLREVGYHARSTLHILLTDNSLEKAMWLWC